MVDVIIQVSAGKRLKIKTFSKFIDNLFPEREIMVELLQHFPLFAA